MSESTTPPAPSIDAVICTRDRPGQIGAAVQSVLAVDHPSFMLTVVDQSTDERTREIVERLDDPRLRYHHSAEPGLSKAYNTAVAITSAPILAFTDDDCIAPADWLSSVESAFADEPAADLLYGQVLPLERRPDDWRLVPSLPITDIRRIGPETSFRAVGMGANCAARRRLFEVVGGFDEILGGGGPLRSSQDFDMSYRAWKGGRTILLSPHVRVYHDGRREEAVWPSLLTAYGIGDGAFYSKHVRCRDPYAMWIFGRHLTLSFGRHVARRLLGHRSTKWPYLRGMLTGVREGLRFDVDRTTCQYVVR